MVAGEPTPALPKLVAGWLCLDFTNTVEPRHEGQWERDHLSSYPDLVAWGRHAGVLDDATVQRLLREAASRPTAARAAFASAMELREVVYRVFSAVAAGARPAPADLDAMRQAYAEAMRHARLRPAGTRFDWSWDDETLDRPWWPVARSAVDLATAGPIDRVKLCPTDEGCAWLFVDTSKNRSRRWCSMEDCGSHVKAGRQTARRRAARLATQSRPARA